MATKFKGTLLQQAALDAYISLRRAANSMNSYLNAQLLQNNLTAGQFGVLEALLHLGSLSQKELSQKILASKGNITMIVDNLEKQSWVKRVADPHDRRITMIELTSAGKAFIEKIVPEHLQCIIQAMSVLTLDELHELKRLSKKVGLSIKQEKIE